MSPQAKPLVGRYTLVQIRKSSELQLKKLSLGDYNLKSTYTDGLDQKSQGSSKICICIPGYLS